MLCGAAAVLPTCPLLCAWRVCTATHHAVGRCCCCCCDANPRTFPCRCLLPRRLAGADLLYNTSSSSSPVQSVVEELGSAHHKRALLAVGNVLDDTMAGFLDDFIDAADTFGNNVQGIIDGIRAFESKLLELPLEEMVEGVRFIGSAKSVLGKLAEPFGVFKSLLQAIEKVASKLE